MRTCPCCGDPKPTKARVCWTCEHVLEAIYHMRDTPKRERLHQVIMYISKGVDD